MSKAKYKVHSKWSCPKCYGTYESPLCGTREVRHTHNRRRYNLVRTWQSKYDLLK